MKKLRVALIAAGLLLPACYDFDFPLDPRPQVAVDPRLIGTWRCLGAQADSDDAPALLRIERRSEAQAHWTFESLAGDGAPEKSEYDVHASSVQGASLLNALELGEKANGKWNFVRYSFLLPDVLRVQVVNDEPFAEVKDAAGLRKEVEKRKNDPRIYTDFLVCVRKKAADGPSPSPTAMP